MGSANDEELFVRVGSVGFQSALPAQNGFNIRPGGFKGWNDGAPTRRDAQAVAQGHGDFDVPDFKGSRVVTIEGFCKATNLSELGIMQGRFTGIGALGPTRFSAREFGRTLWGDARVDGTPEFDASDGLPRAEFAIDLYFRDPRKYGETRTFASGEAAYHHGNFPATPVITVSGTIPGGYTLNGPGGKKYVVGASVTPTDTHTIDMATGTLRIDNVPVYGLVSQADTWAIPPGQQVVVTLAPNAGSGAISMAVVDTYV